MKIAAVIAEYNPFHNGHAYQLGAIRQQTGADFILVMMSGDFVQRGAPACIDKYTRCRMALTAGADMVCELPVYGATGSAEFFAESAVALLDHLGCVDTLCFGVETVNTELFHTMASTLVDEPGAYKALLQTALKTGQNFPAARSHALCAFLKNEQCRDILSQPNNILAIEYMKALYKFNSPIQPFPIKRTGANYHNTNPSDTFSSATAIRQQLSEYSGNLSAITDMLHIPDAIKPMMQSYLDDYPILTRNDFSDILAARLLDSHTELTDYVDINSDLANRIDSFRYQFLSVEQFITLLSARNLTGTRIARCLFHLILNHRCNDLEQWKSQQYHGFLRLLGFRKSSAAIWKKISPSFKDQLITRTSAASHQLSGIGLSVYEADLYASRLYRQILRNHSGHLMPDIASEPVIILP